ncbi:DUF3800 domain-containing protein [Fibrobacter sp. UWR1]|uniref:DUF3800 domain-containing protein n=1 Tax=Fibrobacter sp. UWR1 TaxID=2135645 RepID=UPI000DAED71C|nr:DUF3800 domain-containing protein [Fibrobacter sp. UWR1]
MFLGKLNKFTWRLKFAYYYFDESGDPRILGHHGKNLLQEGSVSKTFSVGYVEISNPHQLLVDLEKLRKELMEDEYLQAVPSMRNLKNGFHANKDCAEVKEKVFKLLKKSDFEAYIIVARKNESVFRRKFNMSDKKLYKFLVAELLKNRLHLYSEIDIYFSEMGNVVSVNNMTEALNDAIAKFQQKWGKENNGKIRVFLQQPSHLPLLQVIDYVLWTVFRVYEKNDFRYFNFIREKIKLVHDIFDVQSNQFYGTFYTEKKPLEQKNWSPISG